MWIFFKGGAAASGADGCSFGSEGANGDPSASSSKYIDPIAVPVGVRASSGGRPAGRARSMEPFVVCCGFSFGQGTP